MDHRNRVAQHIGSFGSAASCVSGTELDREDQQETPGALHWLATFYSQLRNILSLYISYVLEPQQTPS